MSQFLSAKHLFLHLFQRWYKLHGVIRDLAILIGGKGGFHLSCHSVVSLFTDDISADYRVRPATLLFSRL